ncbi:MAG: M48 family metalloprotease [Burkholderiaceae bacterium]
MDYFRHQSEAQTRSRQLIALFGLAVALVALAVNAIGAGLWFALTSASALPDYFLATNTFIVLLFVLGGSWLEWANLEKGGAAIAHQLRARTPSRYDIRHKRLTNIAEEMALAAGIPVPQVFVLDHESINALAAGHDAAHAAIVVTEGALQKLTRDELQGVVAHEISHIIHGDAAMNTRLTGALYGLYSLHILGRNMLDAAWHVGSRSSALSRRSVSGDQSWVAGLVPVPLLILAGLTLCAVGWLGKLCGHLVQAGVSRQREYLADARAVQLTRSRDGIGGALRKISGQHSTSAMGSAYSEVVSHFWLSADSQKTRWFDTHPPLINRVRRIFGRPLPPVRPDIIDIAGDHYAGNMPAYEPLPFEFAASGGLALAGHGGPKSTDEGFGEKTNFPARRGQGKPAAQADNRSERGRESLNSGELRNCARHEKTSGQPAGLTPAQRLLAIARDPGASLSRAAHILNAIVVGPGAAADDDGASDPGLHDALLWLEQPQGQWLRVPLIELLSAQLRDWPTESRQTLVRYCHDAVLADGRVEKTEWVYFTLVRHRLLPEHNTRARTVTALDKRKALADIFSMAASLSSSSARQVREVLVNTATTMGVSQPATTPENLQFRSLSRALDVLTCLPPLKKPALLRALESLENDNPDAIYRAFLAAVAAAIDCPPLRLSPPDQNAAGQPSESHIA